MEYERYILEQGQPTPIFHPGYVEIWFALGYMDGEDFVEMKCAEITDDAGGLVLPFTEYIKIVDPDYLELVSKLTQADKPIAEEIGRILNEFLVDKGYIQGTVI